MVKVTVKEKQDIFYRELAKYGVKHDAELTPENWELVARVFNKLGIKSEIPNFEDILAAGKRKNSMLNQLDKETKRGGYNLHMGGSECRCR